MQNYKKIIEKTFSFLEESFTKNVYSCNEEINIVYSNKKVSIEVLYDWGMDRKYHAWVVIEKNGVRKNLLDCYELFVKEQLHEFKNKIVGKTIKLQIELYSKFIADNIFKLQ